MKSIQTCLYLFLAMTSWAFCNTATGASFDTFAKKLQSGDPVSVVFFGGSLTYGANASEPYRTSYRGRMMTYLMNKYPRTPFRFHDAAIGGTGSSLGIFRMDRDVFVHKPDLVFLDFTANDGLDGKDEPKLAFYESILRRLISRDIPVVQLFFGFKWQFGKGYSPEKLFRRTDHMNLAKAYGTGTGDLFPLMQSKLTSGELTIDEAWNMDQAHPGDRGYAVFFEAAKNGFETALKESRVCRLPKQPVYSDRFENAQRLKMTDMDLGPEWVRSITFRTSLWFDGLSSRWMDDVMVLTAKPNQKLKPFVYKFKGQCIGIFGEGNEKGMSFIVKIDGKEIIENEEEGRHAFTFNTAKFDPKGNLFRWSSIARDLEPGEHTLEIIPLVNPEGKRELRIESICIAGH